MKCIFIGGADRSGTTMLASLLRGIHGSVVTPESLFKTDVGFPQPFSSEKYCDKLNTHPKFKHWNVDLDGISTHKYSSYKDFYECLLKRYNSNKQVDYWIDHSPNNLVYSKLLNSIFNDCYFIRIVRDGRAVARSQIPLEWGENTYLQSSKAWLNKILYGFITQSLFPDRTILVKYEDLLSNHSNEIGRLLQFLGKPKMANGEATSQEFVPEFSKKQHTLVGKPPNTNRADAWKKELTQQNIADFQYYASEALNALGYELVNVKEVKITKAHIFAEYLKELLFKKIVNPSKYKKARSK
ncbi:sulfotransferase [Paraglaciecola sp.]|uniref:sulfotransferase family protein n=1 Tax=Paraglaciecola sp. TaxID=1920173 RepID=UPI00326593D6